MIWLQFLLVLGVVVVSFSQVLLSILAGENPPQPCNNRLIALLNEAIDQAHTTGDINAINELSIELSLYEDCHISTHYKRSYEMLIGQWNIGSFQSDLSYAMFVVVSLLTLLCFMYGRKDTHLLHP